MSKINTSIQSLIGNTPLLELVNLEEKYQFGAKIIAKLEYFNVNQSTKDRIALAMIEEAERSGKLKPGYTIVEATSGNTGIAVAAIAASKGYPARIYMQDNVSKERAQVVKAFGAELVYFSDVPFIKQVLAENDGDFVLALKKFKEEVLKTEKNIFFCNQMENKENVNAHRSTTGPEIWKDTDGDIDILVSTVGTTGTLMGAGSYLKEKNPNIKVVAVQPGPNSLPKEDGTQPEKEITGVHPIEGIPEENIPAQLNREIVDELIEVEAEEAYATAKEVAKTDGILIGTSSAAGLTAAKRLAALEENKGKKIVVVAADTGLRYLSKGVFD